MSDDKPQRQHWIFTIPIMALLGVAASAGAMMMQQRVVQASLDRLGERFEKYAAGMDTRVRAIEDKQLIHETRTADGAVHTEMRRSKKE
jgi:short subunit dehydrogenase-like uncharacterized protein